MGPLDRLILDQALPWWQRGHPWPDLAGWHDWPIETVGILFLPFMLLVFWRMNATGGRQQIANRERKHRDTPAIERILAWLKPPGDPCSFGGLIASFAWLPHMIVFGAPGSGKSTFMYNRIVDPLVGIWALVDLLTWGLLPRRLRRGKLIITGNLSKPFRAAILWLLEHGFPACIWTANPVAGEGFGLDLCEGPAENFAERMIAMQPVGLGNTGLRSGAVEGMLVDACYQLERSRTLRTFGSVLALMPTLGKRELDANGKPRYDIPTQPLTANERAGVEDWSTRIRTITRRLGASVGHDLRLSEVLERREAILVECSSYNNPNSVEPLMHMLVYLSMWLVGAVSNFDLIIDEPGAVGPGTFTRLLTATRAWGVKILIGMQSRKQVDDTLREMCHTSLLCGSAGSSPEAREFESKVTDGDILPEDFVLLEPKRWYEWLLPFWPRRGLYALEAYLFSNGRIDKVHTSPCDLSILKRWPTGSIPCLPAVVTPEATPPFQAGEAVPGDSQRRIVVREVPRQDSGESDSGGWVRAQEVRPSFPALPPPSIAMRAYTSRTYRDRGCLRWKGKHDRKGHIKDVCETSCKLDAHERGNYGYIYLEEEEKTELVHRWRWKQAYGEIGKDPVTGKKLTVDHSPRCARDCSELTHLSLKTRGDNSAARAQDERNGVSYR